MDLTEVIKRRRMTRHFSAAPVAGELITALLRKALQAPSAGSSRGVDLVLLDTAEARDHFYDLTTTGNWYDPGIRAAPVVVVPTGDPVRYVERYSRPDKSHSSLAGLPAAAWPVPYWQVDAAFVTMQLLLLAEEAGLGALFHRLHRDPTEWLAAIGAPRHVDPIGAVVLGWSSRRARAGRHATSSVASRSQSERIHAGRW